MSTPLGTARSAQATAAVRGWQQTVNAAWSQQNGQLAGGARTAAPVETVTTARKAFFDSPVGKGDQRKIIKTNAIIPGGRDGIIVNRFYIKDRRAAFGALSGDGRGPTTKSDAGSRAIVAWDTRTGEVALTVTKSTIPPDSTLNPQPNPQAPIPDPNMRSAHAAAFPINVGPRSLGAKDRNNFVVNATPKGLNIKYDLLNSGLPDYFRWGAVQGQINLNVDDRTIRGAAYGENYPDREVIQYHSTGAAHIKNWPMGTGGAVGTPVYGNDYNTPRGGWQINRR